MLGVFSYRATLGLTSAFSAHVRGSTTADLVCDVLWLSGSYFRLRTRLVWCTADTMIKSLSLRGAREPAAAANTLLLILTIHVLGNDSLSPHLLHFGGWDLFGLPIFIRGVNILVSKINESNISRRPHSAILRRNSSWCSSSGPWTLGSV